MIPENWLFTSSSFLNQGQWYVAYKPLGAQLVVVLRSRTRSLGPIYVCGGIFLNYQSATSNEMDVRWDKIFECQHFYIENVALICIPRDPCARDRMDCVLARQKSQFDKSSFSSKVAKKDK